MACFGLLLAGCSHPAASPPSAAAASLPPALSRATGANDGDAERVLNVFNWAEFIEPAMVAAFEKEYGIKVHYDVYETNEMMEVKLLSGHTNYDVVVPGGSFFEREVKAGVYRALDRQLLPHLSNLDPDALHATEVLDPGNAHGVAYMWLISVGLGYDPTKIKARLPAAPLERVTIEYSIPREGSLGIVDVLAIPADAPHPRNAHLFIDYLLRPEVAAKNAMKVTYASGVAGAAVLEDASFRSDTAIYPPPAARARLVPMRARSQEFTRALVRAWTRFKTGQ